MNQTVLKVIEFTTTYFHKEWMINSVEDVRLSEELKLFLMLVYQIKAVLCYVVS